MQALCIVNVASVDDEQVLNANLPIFYKWKKKNAA